MVSFKPVLMSKIKAETPQKLSIQIFLLLLGLRRFLGQNVFFYFFHFCQHNFMEREYQWDGFKCLIKSRSVRYFPPFLFIFSYPFHLSLNNLMVQAFLPSLFSLSLIPSFPSLSCIPHAPVHPLSAQQSGATS